MTDVPCACCGVLMPVPQVEWLRPDWRQRPGGNNIETYIWCLWCRARMERGEEE